MSDNLDNLYKYIFEHYTEKVFFPHIKLNLKNGLPLESITFAPLCNEISKRDKLKFNLFKAGYEDIKFHDLEVKLRRY